MAHPSQAEDHPAVLVEVHAVVLVSVQVLEEEVHGLLVVLLLQTTDIFAPFTHEWVFYGGSALCANSFTHPQQLPKFILEKLLQLCSAQRVGVSFPASIFIEGFDEEAHGLADVRHPGSCFQKTQIKSGVNPNHVARLLFPFSDVLSVEQRTNSFLPVELWLKQRSPVKRWDTSLVSSTQLGDKNTLGVSTRAHSDFHSVTGL